MLRSTIMIRITNRILEQTIGFSHPQIKRWAVAFLDADPASGQHSGKIRSYTFEEAVKLYIGGFLVSRLKFNLKEAAEIIRDITSWLTKKGWPISEFVEFEKDNMHKEVITFLNDSFGWEELIINVARGHKGFMYEAKEVIEHKSEEDPCDERKTIFREKYRLHYFGDDSHAIALELFREIYFSKSVEYVASCLSKVEGPDM